MESVVRSRLDGKHSDGMTSIQSGKMLVRDVTGISILADSYVAAAARVAEEEAKQAAARKCAKYAELLSAELVQMQKANTGVNNQTK